MLHRLPLPLLACLLLTGCGQEQEDLAEPLPLVRMVHAAPAMEDAVVLRGAVVPRERLRLGFKAPGLLKSLTVREGERVRAGQLLAILDNVDALSQAGVARASLERARREAERAERLVREGALPAVQWEDAKTQLESAEALWKQAADGIHRTRLLSPIPGTLHQRLAEPGEIVGAGVPVLVVDSTDRPLVRVGVTVRELSLLRVGMAARILVPGALPREARIIGVAASPGDDGSYGVDVAPLAGTLQCGTLVQVKVAVPPRYGSIRIPFSALVNRQGRDLVAVLHSEDGTLKVRLRPVEVERADGQGVTLSQGVAPGERLVAEGAFQLQDGQAVRILE